MKTLVDLMTATAVQSKQDGRMATFIKVDENNDDNVILDMERIGLCSLPLDVVCRNFIFHMDNKSLVKVFLQKRGVRNDVPTTDQQVHFASQDVFEVLSRRFKDLKHLECYQAVREYCAEA